MTIKIRGFNAAAWVGTEVLAERQIGLELDTRKFKVGNGVATWAALPYWDASGAAGSSVWGGITGTLSAQTDLQAALNARQPLATVLTNTTAAFTTAQETKLSGVATGATVNSADAVLLARANHTGTQSLDTTTDSATRLAMTAAERTKLTGIATGATANAADAALRDRATHTGTQAAATITGLATVATSGAYGDLSGIPLTFAPSAHGHVIADVTGLQLALDGKQPLATVLTNTTAAFTTAQETKLAGIATGATVNATDAALRDRATHTGAQAIATITGLQTALDARQPLATVLTNTTAAFTTAQETKLSGIATGATANATDAALRDRSTHTSTQEIATVTGLQAELDAKQATLVSGTNIKTVGGVSLLGSGDVPLGGGGGPFPIGLASAIAEQQFLN